jgi:uncharacterized delta-60 repeat protein
VTDKQKENAMSKPKSTGTRRVGEILLAACLLALLLIPSAQATPGALDPSFGTGGEVTTAIGAGTDISGGVVLQADGKLVAAGYSWNGSDFDFALARYNPDGSLDTGFNGTGKVTTAIGSGRDVSWALALQPDGKIVVAGSSNNGSDDDFALARYNPDGSPDTGFNGTGKVTTGFGPGDDYAAAILVQPDGKLVAAGSSQNGSDYDFALARYNPDGSLDTNFHGTGKVTTAIGPGDDYASSALALQPDGKVVLAGQSYNGSNYDVALARYNPDGSLDTNFNGTGKVTTAIGPGYDDANALALQPDGKLVVAGLSSSGWNNDFALARYNPDGSLDTNFNGTGKVTTAIGPGNDNAYGLSLQPDGKLIAAGGSQQNGSNDDFALARYNSDGSLDTSFNGTGKVTTAIGLDGVAYALALQPDGKLVAAGFSYDGSHYVFALARYLNSSTLTVSRAGSGSGSVTSSPSGIDCGATCSASFAAGPVTLTATPSAGSSFTGWSGDCSGSGSCTLSMNADQTATATFESHKTLTLTKAGDGTGTVTSSPSGISCASSCASSFTYGTTVTLTASAAAGSSFAGWSGGGCSGTGTCMLTLDADKPVTATFAQVKTPPPPLCIVPKVKGKTLKAAKRSIKRAHCSVGKVTRAFSAKVKRGRVLSQKPKPGRKLAAGSKVRLTLSKGKKT